MILDSRDIDFENGVLVMKTKAPAPAAVAEDAPEQSACGCNKKGKMQHRKKVQKIEEFLLIMQVAVAILSLVVLVKTYNKVAV